MCPAASPQPMIRTVRTTDHGRITATMSSILEGLFLVLKYSTYFNSDFVRPRIFHLPRGIYGSPVIYYNGKQMKYTVAPVLLRSVNRNSQHFVCPSSPLLAVEMLTQFFSRIIELHEIFRQSRQLECRWVCHDKLSVLHDGNTHTLLGKFYDCTFGLHGARAIVGRASDHLHPIGLESGQVSNENKDTMKYKVEVWLATG